jgi:hypothetical protein
MAKMQFFVLYKTPNERRLEAAIGYLLGIAIALALRRYTRLEPFLCLLGILAGFLISFVISTTILRMRGRMLPVADVNARRVEEVARQSLGSAVLERTFNLMLLVVTLVSLLIIFEGSVSDVRRVAEFLSTDRWFFGFLFFMVLWIAFSAWRQEKRRRRRLENPSHRTGRPFAQRLLNWSPTFYVLAGVLFAMGLAATMLTPNGWRPLIAGIVCAMVLAVAARTMAVVRVSQPTPRRSGVRMIQGMIVAGVIFVGLPLGVIAAGVQILAVFVSGAHPIWGMVGGKGSLLMTLIPIDLAIALPSGLAFGIALGAFISALNFVSPMFEFRETREGE